MRICVSGAQGLGKSTFIQDFLKEWPMYSTPLKTYRDLVKKKKIKINKNGNAKSQLAILNYHIDEIQKYTKDDNVILDRGVLDPLIFSLWLYEKGKGISDDEIEDMLKLTKMTMPLYDIIFIVPLLKKTPIKMVPDEFRDTDEVYQQEINNIFMAAEQSYFKHGNIIFPLKDCPAIISLSGSREERIALAKFYVGKDGGPFGEEESLIKETLENEI
jgi:predicted ATPase